MSAKAICIAYASGLSIKRVATDFQVADRTVRNILRRHGCTIRTIGEGVALRWTEPAYRANQIEKKRGRPNGALGRTWTLSRPVQRLNLRGSKNHMWKGGRITLQLRIRRSGLYGFWRREVFTRDGYTCVVCGASRVRIEADHIYPFGAILDKFNIRTIEDALTCGPLFDIANGRTLCKPCHRQTDTFGSNRWKRGLPDVNSGT